MSANDSLPDDVATLKAMLIAAQAACLEAQAKARNAEAEARARALLIEQMKFTIAKLRHERFGQSSERGAVLEQLELRQARDRPVSRGRAGSGLLAHVLVAKYGLHLPLNRQSTVYAREGIDLDVSPLADWVGACAATLMPLIETIRGHVFAAERIHADDTTVPVLAKGKTRTGRLWAYVRDDQPFGGSDPPAAAFFYSRDRGGEHPEQHLASYAGLMQADAYAGFNRLYEAGRKPGPIVEVACWAHARRKVFDLARLNQAPIAIERIDALF